MRRTYLVLASLVAGLVVVQAAAIAFAFGGLAHHVSQGGTFDKAMMESQESAFTGDVGLPVHAIVGGLVIPLAVLALVVVSFFAGVRHGVRLALVVLGLVVVQAMLGYSIVDLPFAGAVHGANALAVFASAVVAARAARSAVPAPPREAGEADDEASLPVRDPSA